MHPHRREIAPISQLPQSAVETTGFLPERQLLRTKTATNPACQFTKHPFAVGHPKVVRKAAEHWVQVSDDLFQIHRTVATCDLTDFVLECGDLFGLDASPGQADLNAQKLHAASGMSLVRLFAIHGQFQIAFQNGCRCKE